MKKLFALLLALVLVFSLTACGGKKTEVDDTIVVGYSYFNSKFSPFFATTAYDQDVASMVHLGLLGTDRGGAVVLNGIEGETRTYNGTEYFYDGIADCVVTINDDGTTTYDITMRDDIVFSDGTPMTIDDAIFSFYVYCDPTYDGSSTIYAQPIVGMDDYRAGVEIKANLIAAAGPDNTDFTFFTEQEAADFWAAVPNAGVAFVESIAQYCRDAGYDVPSPDVAMGLWGFDVPAGTDAAGCWEIMYNAYGGDIITLNSVESITLDLFEAIYNELGDASAVYTAGVQTGESAPNIAGLEKTGDYSLRVTMEQFDATAILNMGWTVAPMHYYGDASLYDYDNNSFGFVKGDLSSVREKTTQPMGAGPYKFVSYENGVVTFEANENYWKGEPVTKYILFQEGADADKLTGVATGTFDISDPSVSDAAVKAIKGYNSNGELTGDVITTSLIDNNGYGYIGMCAERVKVGNDAGSEESRNLRKGIATVLAVYRDAAINSYYGDRAVVINYPISNTSWAAPLPADEGYEVAYSTDVDGNPIYTDTMTDDEKYAAALEAAIGFIKAAGYTFDEATGKFTAAPAGASLAYELQIPADGVGDHPAFAVVTNASLALESIGITLQVTDLANSSTLFTDIEAGAVDIWAAAWGNSLDPDMYQVYHSTNVPAVFGGTGTSSNNYAVRDAELDELIMAGRNSADTAYRKGIYKQGMEIVLDWGVEVPTYQRKNMVIFSSQRIDMATVTPDMTPFWGWMAGVETIAGLAQAE